MTPRDGAIGVLVPLVISLAVLLLVRRSWSGPIALAAGFCGIVPTILGRTPQLWPASSPDCIFYIAMFTALVGVADLLLAPPRSLRLVGALPVFAAAMLPPLWRRLLDPETQAQAVVCFAVATLGAWVWWYVFDRPVGKDDRFAAPLGMLILTAFTSVVLGMSHSVTYGRIGLALMGSLAPIVMLDRPLHRYHHATSAVACVGALAPLLLAGKLFTDLTVLNLLLIALAPLCFLIAQRFAKSSWPHPLRVAICLLSLILPLATAAALLVPDFIETLRMASGASGY